MSKQVLSWVRAAHGALISGALLLPMISGCGDDGLGSRYSVSGTVTHKGQPIEEGAITFTPVDVNGRPATGSIAKGKYSLSTIGTNDGAMPGDYKVGISSRVPDLSKAQKNAEKTGGILRQDDVAKAYAQAKGGVPPKFEVGETSGLTAKVGAKSNSINFDVPE